jgi:hypothetical protein
MKTPKSVEPAPEPVTAPPDVPTRATEPPADPCAVAAARIAGLSGELRDILVEHAEVIAADLPTAKAAERLGILRDRIRLVVARLENAGRAANDAHAAELGGKVLAAVAERDAALAGQEREQEAAVARFVADFPDAEGRIAPLLRQHVAAKAEPFRVAAANAQGRADSLEAETARPYVESVTVGEMNGRPIPTLANLRGMAPGQILANAGHLVAAVLACKVRP